jgi:hypothetical protein
MEILGINQMNIYDRVLLKRYNIEINYPTLGILELIILTCLAFLFPGISKINPNKIGCNNISQNVIKGIIKIKRQWDEIYK